MDFLAADPSAKYALVENLTKSWPLASSGLVEPLMITKELVAIFEVRQNRILLPSTLLLVFPFG